MESLLETPVRRRRAGYRHLTAWAIVFFARRMNLRALPEGVTPEQAKQLLREFFRQDTKNGQAIHQLAPANSGLLYNWERAWMFDENWRPGSQSVRYAFERHHREPHWRLIIRTDRFLLTLPYVTEAIR